MVVRAAALAALVALPAVAGAQEPVVVPEGAARAVLALDDRANEAWLYGMRVLSPGYPGPSAAESLRALAHGAKLVAASDAAGDVLEAAGRAELAERLDAGAAELARALCPGLSQDEWPDLLRADVRALVLRDCETTSTLVEAVRDYVNGPVREVLEAATRDCAWARRLEARHLRSAVEQARAAIGTAMSVNLPEERRELVADLRAFAAAARRPGTTPARAVPARTLSHAFPAPHVERYAAALAAWSAAGTPADRARLAAPVAAAARALASAPNPLDAQIGRLNRGQAAFVRALGSFRAGAPEPVVLRTIASARGEPELDDIADFLARDLREHWAACPGAAR